MAIGDMLEVRQTAGHVLAVVRRSGPLSSHVCLKEDFRVTWTFAAYNISPRPPLRHGDEPHRRPGQRAVSSSDGERLSDDELVMETLLILIGGDETTRHTLSGTSTAAP